jgi:hypothetical protein
MAQPSSLAAAQPSSRALDHAERRMIENVLWRRDVLRRVVIVVLALSLAVLVVSFVRVAGSHLLATWWIQSEKGVVDWELDATNWRQGGTTSVIFSSANFWHAHLSNNDLDYLHRLHHVVSLSLAENDRITNKGLARLRGLDFLAELDLSRLNRFRDVWSVRNPVPLTDACLVHLQALPRLEVLTLSGNHITDEGLAQLSKFRTLKTLDLEATEITDAGLVHLAAMKNLESVNLGATRVTKAGIAQLRANRPDLTIALEADAVVEAKLKEIREQVR